MYDNVLFATLEKLQKQEGTDAVPMAPGKLRENIRVALYTPDSDMLVLLVL